MYEQQLQEVWVLSMKRILTALTVAATMFASSASAFDPDDLQKLKDTGECMGCDLSGANLGMDANLEGANLARADLEGANLFKANLFKAFLVDADLTDARLLSANLEDASLRGAAMRGVILCNTIMPDGSVIYSGC